MQRETFEQAGFRAHSMGVPRNLNPYVRPDGAPRGSPERRRLDALAAHWWDGWDSRQARVGGRRGK